MTERNYGHQRNEWTGVVVNRDDPLKAGRVQVRIYGIHDDKTNVPDKSLPWVYPEMHVGSASLNHTGVSPTGVLVGSTVGGYFADKDMNVPVYTGTKPRSVIQDPQGNQRSQPDSPDKKNDLPPNARGVQKTGAEKETNFGKDHIYAIKSSHPKKAQDATETGDQAVKFMKMISPMLKTVGNIPFQDAQKLLNVIKQVDANNASGAIQSALDPMIALKNLTSAAGALSSGGGFTGIIQDIAKMAMSGGGGGGGGQQSATQAVQSLFANASNTVISNTATIMQGVANNSSAIPPELQQLQQQNRNNMPGGGGGGGGGNQNMAQMVSTIQGIIQQVGQNFLAQPGKKGGLGSFDVMHGAMKMMEDQLQKMFSSVK